MIHIIKESGSRHIGLNLYRAAGGFVAIWAWYDARTYTMSFRRFRLRLRFHRPPESNSRQWWSRQCPCLGGAILRSQPQTVR